MNASLPVSRVFFGNFDFEQELTDGECAARAKNLFVPRRDGACSVDTTIQRTRRHDRRILTQLAAAWLAVANADDIVVAVDPPGSLIFSDLAAAGWPVPRFVSLEATREPLGERELVPWGWTDSMARLAVDRGWAHHAPPLDVVRQINSRRFRFELETELGVELPGSGVADTADRLRELVADAGGSPQGWIVKANYGMAGRESLRGRGPELNEPQLNWARRRIDQAGCVVFEPLVQSLGEAGIQIEVPQSGSPRLIGVTPLLVDRAGTYRGSRFGSHDVDVASWEPGIETALEVARRVQSLGYFGPLGIDAMWYHRANGPPCLRPLQDLNARYTMGRLALGFERILPAGWCASWLHFGGLENLSTLRQRDGENPRAHRGIRWIKTSPDETQAFRSILLMAESADARQQAETDRQAMIARMTFPATSVSR